MYIFDTASLIELLKFPRSIFPSMWDKFDVLVQEGKVLSVKEVKKELEERFREHEEDWIKKNASIFLEPKASEALFIIEIFKVRNFQNALERQKMLKGGAFADPFVIAKAQSLNGIVVTEEKYKTQFATFF